MTIDTTATPLGANPPTDRHPAAAPGQGIVHTARPLPPPGAMHMRIHRQTTAVALHRRPRRTRTCQFLRMGTSSPAYHGHYRGAQHPHRWPPRSARRRRPDHTERASTNNADGHER